MEKVRGYYFETLAFHIFYLTIVLRLVKGEISLFK